MTTQRRKTLYLAIALLAASPAACGDDPHRDGHGHGQGAHGHGDHAEEERGPHGGRILRDGDFALEIAIHEAGTPPRFRLHAYEKGRKVAPDTVTATVTLSRLGGRQDRFAFRPEGDYLAGDGVVTEPHSFDVTVEARRAGRTHRWSYASYEGRTTIADAVAGSAGVATEIAGPALIRTGIDVIGRLAFASGAEASVKARFAGKVLELTRDVGDRVRAGEMLARVESNQSLQSYAVLAPIAGVVIERHVTVGDVTGDAPLYRIGDTGRLVADFPVFGRDMGRVRPGQPVEITPANGGGTVQATIAALVPMADASSQAIMARAPLPTADATRLPGMAVRGRVIVEETEAPLAVRTSAIQRFRDFEVVYAKVGETYEVRMLDIGRRTPEWTEVLGGLEAGEEYVTANSYLIKADIEKSGASHDH